MSVFSLSNALVGRADRVYRLVLSFSRAVALVDCRKRLVGHFEGSYDGMKSLVKSGSYLSGRFSPKSPTKTDTYRIGT